MSSARQTSMAAPSEVYQWIVVGACCMCRETLGSSAAELASRSAT